jgi:hypothetical protein
MAKRRRKKSTSTCARAAARLTSAALKEAKKRGEKPAKAEVTEWKNMVRASCNRAPAKDRACLIRAKGWKSLQTCVRKAGGSLGRRRRKR